MSTTRRSRPVFRYAAALVCAGAFALVLAGCHRAPPPPSNATPEKAVATSLQLTATGDFDGLMKNRLPPADYATWRTEWDKQHAHPVPASVEQQKQFAEIMRMLTEPGAEAKLAKRLQPELADLRGKGQPMPIFGGILEAAIKQMIAESPQLGPAQQTFANQGLDALSAWAGTTDFSDAKKAGKAIALVCATARELHVQTLDQWRALDYATTMKNYGIIWNGLEKLLDLYGLDIAGSLTDAKASATATDASHATVKLDLKLAGKPLSGEWPMLKQDGHWYDAALLEAWQEAHPAAATSTGASAPAGTAAASGPATTATPAPPSSAATHAPHASATPAASHS